VPRHRRADRRTGAVKGRPTGGHPGGQEARPLISFLVKSFFNEKIRPAFERRGNDLKCEDAIFRGYRDRLGEMSCGHRELKATFSISFITDCISMRSSVSPLFLFFSESTFSFKKTFLLPWIVEIFKFNLITLFHEAQTFDNLPCQISAQRMIKRQIF